MISSKDKKELFMSMVEKAKNGTLDMMRMTDSKEYDRIYSQLENNNGPFGLVVNGITKDGKVSVYLAELMYKQLPSDIVGGSMLSSLEFEESDLSDFLDRFYDMNNMEILNEFFKNQPDYVKNASLQEWKDSEYNDFFDRLAMLNGLDYLSQQENQTTVHGRDRYIVGNDLNIVKLHERDGKSYIYLRKGENFIKYDIREGIMAEKDIQAPQFGEYVSTFLQSIEDLPKVYESITSGTYKRDDFMSTIDAQGKQTPLQQRDIELSVLEAEEKTIAEAEALVDKSKEGQDIGDE